MASSRLLLLEVAITATDFVIEDRTRRLSAFERVLHTALTLLFGVLLMAFAPVLIDWLQQPTALRAVSHGGFSVLLTLMAAGMAAWGIRDALAALKHSRPAEWVRNPIESAERPSGRGVLVTGATGFIGGHVVRAMRKRGDTVWVWTRDADRALARFGPHVHVVTNLADIPADARIDARGQSGRRADDRSALDAGAPPAADRQPRQDHAGRARLVRDTPAAASRAGERQRHRLLRTRRR